MQKLVDFEFIDPARKTAHPKIFGQSANDIAAMAGFTGGGGLGSIAINYGYYRYDTGVMLITVALLVIIVQIFQEVGMRIAHRSDKRINK